MALNGPQGMKKDYMTLASVESAEREHAQFTSIET